MFCVRNGSGRAEKWTSVSPWLEDVREQWASALADAIPRDEGEADDMDGDDWTATGGGGLFSPYKSTKAADAAKAGAYTRPLLSST